MPQIYSKKRGTCQVSESQIITPFFPFSFLLVFFKCTLYLNSVCDKFIMWRQLDGCPSLLSVHRFSWIRTACSKRHKLFMQVLDRNMMADTEDGPYGGKTYCIGRCVRRHICNTLSNKLFFFFPKGNECYNQQSLSLRNCLTFCVHLF